MSKLLCLTAILFTAAANADTPPDAISFSKQVAPVLVAKCTTCHNAEKAKGGYRLHTFEALLQPGKSKLAPVVAGKPTESELFKRITAPGEDDRMPQKGDPLPSEQIERIRRWIEEGAKLDSLDSKAALSSIIPQLPFPPPPERYSRPVPILALAFTSAGTQLAAGGHNEITLWNLSGELQKRITNVTQRVHQIAFYPSAPLMAVAGGKPGRSGELSIYDVKTGELKTNVLKITDELLTVAISSDGKRLAAGGADNTIHVFDSESYAKITTIQQHADWVTCLQFNSNGSKLASASRDRTARIYNALTGDLETTYAGHGACVFSIAFLSDGRVVSGGRDKALHIWDVADGKKKNELSGFEGDLYQVMSTENELFAGGADKNVREYSVSEHRLVRTFSGQNDAVYSLAFYEPAGLLASGSYDGTIKIWRISNGEVVHSFIAAPGFQSSR
ncbi:MAG TPA: c-type cytochrome domain-containing protein [Verrucomicrobiae bacterium]|nr:c-type cytochrome domain-containing protein [Verrucomicrobiae bacterium]